MFAALEPSDKESISFGSDLEEFKPIPLQKFRTFKEPDFEKSK